MRLTRSCEADSGTSRLNVVSPGMGSNPCLPATICPVFSITYSAGCFSVSNLCRPRPANSCAPTTIKVAPVDNPATISRARVRRAHPRTDGGRRVVWPGRSFLRSVRASSVARGKSRSHLTGLMSLATASHDNQTRSCHLDEPGSLCRRRVPNSRNRNTIAAPPPIHGKGTIAMSVQFLSIEAPLRGNDY